MASPLFNGDFSTGDDSQWEGTGKNGGTQDSTSNADTAGCHFGELKFLQDQSGRPGWWGQFNVPASPSVKQRCQVITHYAPIRVDTDEYLTLRVHTAAGWTDGNPGWPVQIVEPNFQALGKGQANFTLLLKPTHIGVSLLAGKSYASGSPYAYEFRSSTDGSNNNLPKMYAVPKGQFITGIAYELIVHVRWAFDRTGVVETWYRQLGSTWLWARTTSEHGFPTLQTNPDGTYKPTTQDCLQLYRGPSNTACKVSMNGYAVHRSFAEADAFLT
jgi:hypothetical protein